MGSCTRSTVRKPVVDVTELSGAEAWPLTGADLELESSLDLSPSPADRNEAVMLYRVRVPYPLGHHSSAAPGGTLTST